MENCYIVNHSIICEMKQVNFNMHDDVDKEFREIVFETKGMRRGAMLEAFQEAIELWMEENRDKDDSS